uniref:Uncharacterized protein LOC100370985 n=1 Tax=Saccoglossus kowalevskii TaxID=10224 RepID=A0ABM0N0M0_SACKO
NSRRQQIQKLKGPVHNRQIGAVNKRKTLVRTNLIQQRKAARQQQLTQRRGLNQSFQTQGMVHGQARQTITGFNQTQHRMKNKRRWKGNIASNIQQGPLPSQIMTVSVPNASSSGNRSVRINRQTKTASSLNERFSSSIPQQGRGSGRRRKNKNQKSSVGLFSSGNERTVVMM